MIPRTLVAMILCLLSVVPLAQAKTRMLLGVGTDVSSVGFMGSEGPDVMSALHLSAAVDAPDAIRKHLPVELVLGYSGLFGRREPMSPPAAGMGILDSRWVSNYWDLRYSTSETVRVYLMGRTAIRHKLDGAEVGVGFGNHQFMFERMDGSERRVLGTRFVSQWRGHLFLRGNILPTQPSGPFLEGEWQHSFGSTQTLLPVNSVLLTLGYRFHI